MNKLEYQKESDKFYNFGGARYQLSLSNITNKIKSNNILINSFVNTNYEDILFNLFNDLKSNCGIDKIIWGIKNVNGNIEWELYFYSNLLDIKKSKLIVDKHFDLPNLVERNWVAMWSFDINDKKEKQINLYQINWIIDHGSSYSYNNNDYKYENDYFFWKDSLKNLNLIKNKILTSLSINDTINIENILIPEFLEWYKNDTVITDFVTKESFSLKEYQAGWGIVTSKKQNCDSIYYMSLNIDMLILFLNKFNYPRKQIDFLEENKNKLSHLLYDVSINYKMENGKFKIVKSGYYGQI